MKNNTGLRLTGPTESEKAYMAGYFDSRWSYLTMRQYGEQWTIAVGIKRPSIGRPPEGMVLMQSVYGGQILEQGGIVQWEITHKPTVYRFLGDLQPFARVKQAQIKVGLECLNSTNIDAPYKTVQHFVLQLSDMSGDA